MTNPRRSQGPDPLLLDEMFSHRVAQQLRSVGIGCIAVVEDRVLSSQDDAVVLEAALASGRTLVTNNVVDFERLRQGRTANGESVPRLVYTSEAAFPRDRKFIGRLVEALRHCAEEHLVAASGGVLWLASPPPQ